MAQGGDGVNEACAEAAGGAGTAATASVPAPLAGEILRTPRLLLRELCSADGAFMLALLNSPPFLRWIGDRGVRSEEQARSYIDAGPVASYRQHGFGMWLVERLADRLPLGVAGLVRRPSLPAADIGFAFPQHIGAGYGAESAAAVLAHAREVLALPRLLAIVLPDNTASVQLLRRLGMSEAGTVQLAADAETLALYEIDFAGAGFGPVAPVVEPAPR